MFWCKSSPVTAQAEVGTQGIFASVLLEAATDYRDYREVCHKLISYLGGMECAITNTTRKHRPIIFWPLLCVLDIIYFSYFNHFSPRGLACYAHLYSASHCWVYIYITLSGNCHCSTRSFWPWKCWCVLNASVPFTVQGPHWGDVNVELMCHFNRASPSVVGMCITGVFLAAMCWSGHTLHISLCSFFARLVHVRTSGSLCLMVKGQHLGIFYVWSTLLTDERLALQSALPWPCQVAGSFIWMTLQIL